MRYRRGDLIEFDGDRGTIVRVFEQFIQIDYDDGCKGTAAIDDPELKKIGHKRLPK